MVKVEKNTRPLPPAEEIIERAMASVPDPEPEPPALTEISLSVKVTIPLVQYGNIEMFVSQKVTVVDTEDNRHTATIDGLTRLKHHIAEVVLPLVDADVERVREVLLKERNPDVWMQKNNSTYRWLRVAQPDMMIPAMERILLGDDSEVITQ